MQLAKFLFSFSFIISTLLVQAQSGMEAIKNNDFFKAKSIFHATIEKDSMNFEALTGLIMLSEISQDYIAFDKYLNTLLRHHKDPYTFALFNFAYKGDFKSIEQLDYPEWVTLKYKINDAIEWGGKNRDRDKLWEKYTALVPKIKWSLIGPFKNVNGSGFVISNPIEAEAYNPEKTYQNQEGMKLHWCNPLYSAATGRIVFSQHLPNSGWGEDAVYYANTFLNLDEDKTIQLQIGRTAPVKIWVNDILLYSNNHSVPFYYDLETLELRLKKGANRILIKNASQKNQDNAAGSLNFWDGNNFEHDMLAIRFTDALGKPLVNPSSSYAALNYNNDGKPIQASVTSHSLVEHFNTQASKADNLWFDYCLLKSYLSENFTKQGEAYFYLKNKANSTLVFYNYLFAKICQFNSKTEKVYELLSKVDETKTPIFGMQFEKLQEINLETEPDKYLNALQKLSMISPSNLSLLLNYIDYYNKTGKQVRIRLSINVFANIRNTKMIWNRASQTSKKRKNVMARLNN